MKNESERSKSSCGNGEKVMDVRNVYMMESAETVDHRVETDAAKGIKAGRLRVGSGGTCRIRLYL